MSVVSIAAYFPFRRLKIINQTVTPEATVAHIHPEPDNRYQPICHNCGQKASGVHSWTHRKIRDLAWLQLSAGLHAGIANCSAPTAKASMSRIWNFSTPIFA